MRLGLIRPIQPSAVDKRWRDRPLLCKIGIHSRCSNWPGEDFCNNCLIKLPPREAF